MIDGKEVTAKELAIRKSVADVFKFERDAEKRNLKLKNFRES